jgi:hypothetical protein
LRRRIDQLALAHQPRTGAGIMIVDTHDRVHKFAFATGARLGRQDGVGGRPRFSGRCDLPEALLLKPLEVLAARLFLRR